MAGVTLTAATTSKKTLTGSFQLNNLRAYAGQVFSQFADYGRIEDAKFTDTGYVLPGFPVLVSLGGDKNATTVIGSEFQAGAAVFPTASGGFATAATVSGFVVLDNPSGEIVRGSDVPAWSAAQPHIKFARLGSGVRVTVPWLGTTAVASLTDKTVVGWDTTNLGLTDAGSPTALAVKLVEVKTGYYPVVSGGTATWTLGLVAVIQL